MPECQLRKLERHWIIIVENHKVTFSKNIKQLRYLNYGGGTLLDVESGKSENGVPWVLKEKDGYENASTAKQ
jgi:hypothetical protein